MNTLSVDFETRSAVPLPETGVYPYAEDETTDVWCMAYAEGMLPELREPALWTPGDPIPDIFTDTFADPEWEYRAWNAAFERHIYREIMVKRYGFPKVRDHKWVCTMIEAAAMALPRALFRAAQVLKVESQKDDAGHRLMMQMAKPRKPRKAWAEVNPDDPHGLYWWDDEARKNRLYKYCLQDVRTEAAVAGRLRRIEPGERELYLLDQKINDRGVGLDMKLVHAAIEIRDEAIRRANVELAALTDGACKAITNTADIRRWLGVESIAKEAIVELLETETDLTRLAVIKLRAQAGKSSVSKLDTMLKVALRGRAHGLLQFLGADTGRWAGRLVQPQNFPRPPKGFPAERVVDLVLAGDYDGLAEIDHPMEVLSNLLRSFFIPREGTSFYCSDFSAIEGWVVSWLAGQDDMVTYEQMAARIFNVKPSEVSEEQRAVGKVAVLGCGFGMGWKKYRDTVYAWTGIRISDVLAKQAVEAFRTLNWQIKNLWYEVEDAAREAVAHPGRKVRCGRGGCITYRVKGPFLWCMLPSGRPLCYPLPQIVDALTPWGAMKAAVEISTTNSYTRKWERRSLYGGLQVENIVQAIARDVMAEAMLRTERAGYDTVLTVHDEILSEAEGGSLDDFMDRMGTTPEWAPGLHVGVDGWEGERYRK